MGLVFLCIGLTSQNAWINEIHYDDAGSDSSEVVEILIENAGDYTLSLFEVFLYNGNGGTVYDSESCNNFIVGDTSGNISIYYWEPSSIQNGAPDGLALAYDDTLIDGQFLSYEGVFLATDGAAAGLLSNDIGVLQDGTTLEGLTLQLAGVGSRYEDFRWTTGHESFGSANRGQTFVAQVQPVPLPGALWLLLSALTALAALGRGRKAGVV